MNFDDFQKQLKSGKLSLLYLFLGQEKYLKREALGMLKAAVLGEEISVFNYTEHSVAAEGLAELMAIAEQYPMFSGKRLVCARDFDKLSDGELDALKSYLKNPQPTTTLVFQTENIDKRRNVSIALIKSCAVVEFNPLKEREAAEWAVAYLRRHNYQILPNVSGLLVGLTGTDLFTLSNELDKLMALLGRPGLISIEDIETLVVRSREHSNFELGDAIATGERKRAVRLLSRQLSDQAEPLLLLSVIARTLRQMLVAKELMQQQAPPDEIAREIGVPPFRVADFLTRARKWEIKKIEYAIKRVAEVDSAIKSSLGRPGLQLEYLVCEILG
jgi:DNA polymerase III subunit delta